MISQKLLQVFKTAKNRKLKYNKIMKNNKLRKDKNNGSQNDMKKTYIYDSYNNDALYEK